jgi:hypothetical protein
MKDIIKTILKIIEKIHKDNESILVIYDKNEVDYLLEKCKLLEDMIDNQYFSNLVSDLEINIEHNIESIYIYDILNSLKLYFNQYSI